VRLQNVPCDVLGYSQSSPHTKKYSVGVVQWITTVSIGFRTCYWVFLEAGGDEGTWCVSFGTMQPVGKVTVVMDS
jgi:hypothetical protein